MYKIWLFIRTLLGCLVIGIAGLICVIPCFIIACLPAKWRYDNRIFYFFSYIFFRACILAAWLPIDIEYETEDILKEPSIVISNHQSSLDIPLIAMVIKWRPHIWLFLARYAKVPIFGFILSRMNIMVDYRGLRKLVGSIDETLKVINGRTSHIILFPEGGRHTDGKVHSFLYGFALMAKHTGRPVLPIMLFNAYKVFPPGAILIRPHPIKIKVGKPFKFLPHETDDEFVQRVHAWYDQQVERHST